MPRATFLARISKENLGPVPSPDEIDSVMSDRFGIITDEWPEGPKREAFASVIWAAAHADDQDNSSWRKLNPSMLKTLVTNYSMELPQGADAEERFNFIRKYCYERDMSHLRKADSVRKAAVRTRKHKTQHNRRSNSFVQVNHSGPITSRKRRLNEDREGGRFVRVSSPSFHNDYGLSFDADASPHSVLGGAMDTVARDRSNASDQFIGAPDQVPRLHPNGRRIGYDHTNDELVAAIASSSLELAAIYGVNFALSSPIDREYLAAILSYATFATLRAISSDSKCGHFSRCLAVSGFSELFHYFRSFRAITLEQCSTTSRVTPTMDSTLFDDTTISDSDYFWRSASQHSDRLFGFQAICRHSCLGRYHWTSARSAAYGIKEVQVCRQPCVLGMSNKLFHNSQ